MPLGWGWLYSWRENGKLGDGHAWIEITKDGTTHSYGLWPDMFDRNGNQILWSGIQKDVELAIKDVRYTSNVEQTSILLDNNQLNILEERIRVNTQNGITWGFWAPWDEGVCSKWATEQWNLVADSNHQLGSRNMLGISNPNSLANSIVEMKSKVGSTNDASGLGEQQSYP